jgi:hypothetical protein
MRGSNAGTKVLLQGSHRRRPNRTRRIKQKDPLRQDANNEGVKRRQIRSIA